MIITRRDFCASLTVVATFGTVARRCGKPKSYGVDRPRVIGEAHRWRRATTTPDDARRKADLQEYIGIETWNDVMPNTAQYEHVMHKPFDSDFVRIVRYSS